MSGPTLIGIPCEIGPGIVVIGPGPIPCMPVNWNGSLPRLQPQPGPPPPATGAPTIPDSKPLVMIGDTGEPDEQVEHGDAGTQAGVQQVAGAGLHIRLKNPPLPRQQEELVLAGGQQLLLPPPKPVHPVCESRQPAARATAVIRLRIIRIPFSVGRRSLRTPNEVA